MTVPVKHPFRRNTTSRRIGFTLIEVVMTVGTFSFVLACVSVVLATLWRAHSDVQHDLMRISTISQLARQLRADAHLAHTAKIVPSQSGSTSMLIMMRPGMRTEYTLEPHRISRILHNDDKIVHREVYVLGESVSASWTITDSAPPLLQVSLTTHDPRYADLEGPVRSESIDAVIGVVAGGLR